MKQKIVINVPMHNEKAKSKAMKIAVSIQGVMKVKTGEGNDQLVVIGEGVDSVCLANSLRKKFCFANIISQEDIKRGGPGSSSKSSPYSSPPSSPPKPPPWQYGPPPQYCPPYSYESRVYDSPTNCSIL